MLVTLIVNLFAVTGCATFGGPAPPNACSELDGLEKFDDTLKHAIALSLQRSHGPIGFDEVHKEGSECAGALRFDLTSHRFLRLPADFDRRSIVRGGDRLFVENVERDGGNLMSPALLNAVCYTAKHYCSVKKIGFEHGVLAAALENFRTGAASSSREWITRMRMDKLNVGATSNRRLAVVDGPMVAEHDGFPRIDRLEVSGIPDTDGKCAEGSCCNSVLENTDRKPASPHATAMAGIIAAKMDGVPPLVVLDRIVSVNIFGYGKKECTLPHLVAAGLYCAIARGADVINVSLATEEDLVSSDDWRDVKIQLKSANKSGALVVAAAGNRGTNLDTNAKRPWPDSLSPDNPALVTATVSDIVSNKITTNSGQKSVDFAIPIHGTNVFAPNPNNNDYSDDYSPSSSAAAAITSAAALLLWSKAGYANCKGSAIKQILKANTDRPDHIQNYVSDGILWFQNLTDAPPENVCVP
jgi:hypothetical protein